MIHNLLTTYELLFYGTLGTWETKPVDIELQLDAKPYHTKPYPVPRAQEYLLNNEVEFICQLELLKEIDGPEWVSHTFIQTKK